MKKRKELLLLLIFCSIGILSFIHVQAAAGTVAYWRFDDGPPGGIIPHNAADGVWSLDILDYSGNGNHLSVWSTGGYAGYEWNSDVPYPTIPRTGAANILSVRNTGGFPGMWTKTGFGISTMSPAAFTIEASFKLENGGYRTIVGRDSYGTATVNAALAAVYFQAVPDNALAIKFCDVEGYWHQAVSAIGIFQSFDFGSDPDGDSVPWYSMAGVSDGSTLSLYLFDHSNPPAGYQLIAQTDLTAGGSTDTALIVGAGDGDDWDAGNWTVGRGLHAGRHVDRAWGFIDEVRISDIALSPSDFLFYEHIPAGVVIAPSDLTIQEEGSTTGEVLFSLEYAPDSNVVLVIEEQDGRQQVTLDQTILTFTPDDWDIPQAIHVTAVDDAVLENAEQKIPLAVTVSSQDSNYDGLNVEPVVVTVLENECGAWGYAPGDLETDCIVDIHDLVRFMEGWMDCSYPDQVGCSDFSGM